MDLAPSLPPLPTTSSASPQADAVGALGETGEPPNAPAPASGQFQGGDDGFLMVLIGGLAVAAIVGGGAFWFLSARRREADVAPADVTAASAWAPAFSANRPARRAPAAWELASALDDKPIGTVDLLPAESLADSQADINESEMHGWGDGTERRSPRRRDP